MNKYNKEVEDMKYEVVTLSKKFVVGKSIKTTNENGQSIKDIGLMWKEFIGEHTKIHTVKQKK